MAEIIVSDDRLAGMLNDAIRRAVGGEIGAGSVIANMNQAVEDCVEDLCNGVPQCGGSLNRITIERIIRCAFRSGALHATNYVKTSEI